MRTKTNVYTLKKILDIKRKMRRRLKNMTPKKSRMKNPIRNLTSPKSLEKQILVSKSMIRRS